MAQRARVSQTIEQIARDRVDTHLQQELDRGRVVVTLAELAAGTALAPTTAEAVMDQFVERGPFSIRRCTGGEIRWVVQP